MRLEGYAARLDEVADGLARAARELPDADPGARAFGADSGGAVGGLGRALRAGYLTVLTAQADEAGRLAAEAAELAGAVRAAGRDYARVDAAAARQRPDLPGRG